MKRILTERNIAGILFIMVMVVFSFAHEDSKKRNNHYNVSVPSISADKSNVSVITSGKVIGPAVKLSDSPAVK